MISINSDFKLERELQETIAEEIAHAYLKHKSEHLDNLTREERDKQETEAQEFVEKYRKK